MFERRHQQLLPGRRFAWRMVLFGAIGAGLLGVALLIGIAGYHWLAGFSLIDSLLNASMILTGMGPVGELASVKAKVFASCYALFSGLAFITLIGILLTPVVHRILHRFHVGDRDIDTQSALERPARTSHLSPTRQGTPLKRFRSFREGGSRQGDSGGEANASEVPRGHVRRAGLRRCGPGAKASN